MEAELANKISKKRWFVTIAAFSLALFVLSISSVPQSVSSAQPTAQPAPTVTPALLPKSDVYSSDDENVKTLQVLVNDQDPTAALTALHDLVKQHPSLMPACHAYAHAIGDAAYAKYGSLAAGLPFSDEMCGAGYLHALVVQSLQGQKDPLVAMAHVCDGQDGYCYHGIGHGLMFYTQNDVPKSLALCGKLDTAEHATRCSEGVFMQNFEDDQMYPAPYFYPNDPLKVCRTEPKYKTACYHYAGAFLAKGWRKDSDIFHLCDAAEPKEVTRCASGMGAYLLAVNLNHPSVAVTYCDAAKDADVTAACIDGMVSYDLVNDNSIPHTEAFCASLNSTDNATCEASLKWRKPYYQ